MLTVFALGTHAQHNWTRCWRLGHLERSLADKVPGFNPDIFFPVGLTVSEEKGLYKKEPRTIGSIKGNFPQEIEAMPTVTLQNVFVNL